MDLSLAQAKALFDGVLLKFPNLKLRLSGKYSVISCAVFEKAVTKIQNCQDLQLIPCERRSVEHLIQEDSNVSTVQDHSKESRSTFALKILEHKRWWFRKQNQSMSTYDSCSVLPTFVSAFFQQQNTVSMTVGYQSICNILKHSYIYLAILSCGSFQAFTTL